MESELSKDRAQQQMYLVVPNSLHKKSGMTAATQLEQILAFLNLSYLSAFFWNQNFLNTHDPPLPGAVSHCRKIVPDYIDAYTATKWNSGCSWNGASKKLLLVCQRRDIFQSF